MALKIPGSLAASCRKTPARAVWLEQLPDVVEGLRRRWSLLLDERLDAEDPTCSFVTAALCQDGRRAVLKVAMPHMEGEQEIDGLGFWNGDPTVRLLAADHDLGAMLLERCEPGTPLRAVPEREQDVVISRLLRRLWRMPSPAHPFRPLSALVEYWSSETLAQSAHWPDSGLVNEGLSLFRELSRNAATEVLLATDLHAGNVLRAEREPWLVIDPKPFLGDPAYDATQHLFNCLPRLRANAEAVIKSFSEMLGVEPERVRLWTFARAAAEPRDDWTNSQRFALARTLRP